MIKVVKVFLIVLWEQKNLNQNETRMREDKTHKFENVEKAEKQTANPNIIQYIQFCSLLFTLLHFLLTWLWRLFISRVIVFIYKNKHHFEKHDHGVNLVFQLY